MCSWKLIKHNLNDLCSYLYATCFVCAFKMKCMSVCWCEHQGQAERSEPRLSNIDGGWIRHRKEKNERKKEKWWYSCGRVFHKPLGALFGINMFLFTYSLNLNLFPWCSSWEQNAECLKPMKRVCSPKSHSQVLLFLHLFDSRSRKLAESLKSLNFGLWFSANILSYMSFCFQRARHLVQFNSKLHTHSCWLCFHTNCCS